MPRVPVTCFCQRNPTVIALREIHAFRLEFRNTRLVFRTYSEYVMQLLCVSQYMCDEEETRTDNFCTETTEKSAGFTERDESHAKAVMT